MGAPIMDSRGITNRGTANRRAAVLPPPADYPPFNVHVLAFGGAAYIPLALSYALKWHLELIRARDAMQAKELADNLIALWEWFKEMEVTSPRAPDGALLVNDPLAQMSGAKADVEFVELDTGEVIPVYKNYVEAPMPVWQPLLFPPELPPEVKANYPARPKNVDDLPPFYPEVVSKWMLASVRGEQADEPAPPPELDPTETGKLVESFEVFEPPTEIKDDEDAAEKAMEAAARELDSERWTVERLQAFQGHTPTVNAAIARLRSTTLNDITRHTQVQFDQAYADVPLIKNTEFILYHSVVSFVLDKDGEPFDLRLSREGKGMIDYPILIEYAGEQMKRSVPADDGVYVSVQKYGFGKFRLNDTGITKLLFGTVGGFTEYGYGYSGPHRIHKALQSYLDRGGSYGFVAAVTVPGLYKREELTWSRIRRGIPEFVDVLIPYLVKEIGKRASYKLENWQEFVSEVLVEVIQQIILDKVKDKVRNYLIKQVGKRIVPGLNAVAALVDLFSGGEERMRIRNILACMLVSLRGKSEEDTHIAAKTCAMVVADEFEDAVMDALVQKSKQGATKLGKRSRAQRDTDEKAARDKPPAKEPPPAKDAPAPAPEAPAPTVAAAPARPDKKTVAQPANVARNGAPKSLGEPLRDSGGAQNVTASSKKMDASQPNVGKVEPEGTVRRTVTKAEVEMLRRGREKQRLHDEKIAKKRQELEDKEKAEREAQQNQGQVAANGDAGTGESGTGNKGKSDQDKGTDDKGTEATATGPAPAQPSENPASAAKPANAARTRRPPRPFKPLSPDDEGRIHVKEPDVPEGSDAVQGEGHIRTGAHSDEKVGRAEFEKKGGAMGIGEQAHHGRQKRGAGEAGEAARENARTGGNSVNQASNMVPAMGLNDDPRAVHGSSAAHSSMHGKEDAETMRQIAETRRDDPEGLQSAEADFTSALYEGRRPQRDPFYLGGDPDPPAPKEPKDPKPGK
jgi:hypothetical protein